MAASGFDILPECIQHQILKDINRLHPFLAKHKILHEWYILHDLNFQCEELELQFLVTCLLLHCQNDQQIFVQSTVELDIMRRDICYSFLLSQHYQRLRMTTKQFLEVALHKCAQMEKTSFWAVCHEIGYYDYENGQ